MNRFIQKKTIAHQSFNKVECSFLPVPNCRADFIQATAEFFVQQWMGSQMPTMLHIWQNWASATDDEKEEFKLYLDCALLPPPNNSNQRNASLQQRVILDNPSNSQTAPIGVFSETMLRWFSEKFNGDRVIIEPPSPQPSVTGHVDLLEVSGINGNFDSFRVTMWECKGSDSQAGYHSSKIYKQLDDYSRRLYYIANSLCQQHQDADPELKRFLKQMASLARNKSPKVHYGVFISYDSNVAQEESIADNLHKHPPGHPAHGGPCHHLVLMLVPDFHSLRMEVWHALHMA